MHSVVSTPGSVQHQRLVGQEQGSHSGVRRSTDARLQGTARCSVLQGSRRRWNVNKPLTSSHLLRALNEWMDKWLVRSRRDARGDLFYGGRSCFVPSVRTLRWGCEKLFHFSKSENLAYSSPSIYLVFVCFSQHHLAYIAMYIVTCIAMYIAVYIAYIATCSHSYVVQMRWTCAMLMCVLVMYSTSGIVCIVFQPKRRCNHWTQSIRKGHKSVF